MISADPKKPGSTRRLAVLFNNEGGSVPELRVTLSDGFEYRFIGPSWQLEVGHPLHPEYQSPAWAAHEVLVEAFCFEKPEHDIWRTLSEGEKEKLNGELWREVYDAIRLWADKEQA